MTDCTTPQNDRLLTALKFASQKHVQQKRKDAVGTPYINHPIEVAELLSRVGGVSDVEVLIAAILYDTVEDTNTSEEEIAALLVPEWQHTLWNAQTIRRFQSKSANNHRSSLRLINPTRRKLLRSRTKSATSKTLAKVRRKTGGLTDNANTWIGQRRSFAVCAESTLLWMTCTI